MEPDHYVEVPMQTRLRSNSRTDTSKCSRGSNHLSELALEMNSVSLYVLMTHNWRSINGSILATLCSVHFLNDEYQTTSISIGHPAFQSIHGAICICYLDVDFPLRAHYGNANVHSVEWTQRPVSHFHSDSATGLASLTFLSVREAYRWRELILLVSHQLRIQLPTDDSRIV